MLRLHVLYILLLGQQGLLVVLQALNVVLRCIVYGDVQELFFLGNHLEVRDPKVERVVFASLVHYAEGLVLLHQFLNFLGLLLTEGNVKEFILCESIVFLQEVVDGLNLLVDMGKVLGLF